MASNNTPPQFVFEIVAVEAVRKFLRVELPPIEVAEHYARTLVPLYDTDKLAEDIDHYIEQTLKFLSSIEVTDVDLLLQSFQFFACNFEKSDTKRNKKPLFRSFLKGQPLDRARVYKASKSLVGYVFGMRAGTVPLKPEGWTFVDEVELAAVLDAIAPPDPSTPR